ncbi:MAG: aldo/keto reductase, partial [Clostridia bacterium]|nr:aldo/keto reductase [Clostridia bacterium]
MKKLGFGLMRLPIIDPADNKTIDIERTKAMADRFMSEGFTYFDTAAPYHQGESEAAFRKAVAERYPRDSYVLTDKLSLFKIEKKEDMPSFFDGQLKKLGVEYLDYYLLHAMSE